jgi:hypothetical protein
MPGGAVVHVAIPHDKLDELTYRGVPHPDDPGEMRGLRGPLPAEYVQGVEHV